ncbi:MAG: UDP-3-O-acylglucosamine N-acyltransferase, partial [Chlamydiia bacterium]|nr:UDP-3-O-acylglucosamine N-acyltransferase [Chlamydiia bacterium]
MSERREISYTLQELADKMQVSLKGDPKNRISGVADLESATENDASFLANARYEKTMASSKAGVIVVSLQQPLGSESEQKNFLLTDDPSSAFQELIELFAQDKAKSSYFSGIHPTAVIHESVQLGKDVTVGPYAVIEKGAQIGDGTTISSHVYIGPDVFIGKGCIIHPQVTIRESCRLQ